jgi:hypothetical protein
MLTAGTWELRMTIMRSSYEPTNATAGHSRTDQAISQAVGDVRRDTQVSCAESDGADAHMLADMVRTDSHQLRAVAGDSADAEGLKVLARTRKTMIWERARQVQRLRHQLLGYYPAAPAPSTTSSAPTGTSTTTPSAASPTGSSASCTAAPRPAPATTRTPPGPTDAKPPKPPSPLDT